MASQLWPMATELHVGESGGMLPQKILNFRPSESDSEACKCIRKKYLRLNLPFQYL